MSRSIDYDLESGGINMTSNYLRGAMLMATLYAALATATILSALI